MLLILITAITATAMLHTTAAASAPNQEVCMLLGQEKLDALFQQSPFNEQPHSTFFKRSWIIEPISGDTFCWLSNDSPEIFDDLCKGKSDNELMVLNAVQKCAVSVRNKTPLPLPPTSKGNRWDMLKYVFALYKSLKCGSVEVLASQLTTLLFHFNLSDWDENDSGAKQMHEYAKTISKPAVQAILVKHLTALRKALDSPFKLVGAN